MNINRRGFRRGGCDMRWSWHREMFGVCIDGCRENAEIVSVPDDIGGAVVKTLRLGRESLGGCCRSLIIPEGIEWVSLDLRDAPGLEELIFPTTARLVCSPLGIEETEWFRRHGNESVYLGGWYCGTPGGGLGSNGELVIADGVHAIASGADYHSFWKSIVMPDSVKIIDDLAFGDAQCLENLRLPSGVVHIGDFAFQNCPRLSLLYLPDSLSSKTAPFMMCSGLREVSMEANCPIKTKFSRCPRIIFRSWEGDRVVRRPTLPTPISGSLSIYPDDGPIEAAGRSYPNFSCLTLFKWRDDICIDRYGRMVQRVECPGEEAKWYLRWTEGITEISHDGQGGAYVVRDGLSEAELPMEVYMKLDNSLRKLNTF